MGKLICVEGLVDTPTRIDVDFIAEFAHEACRQLAEMGGDEPIRSWLHATEEDRKVTIDGVVKVLENPDITPEQSHAQWVENKLAAGWVYGPEKDYTTKQHPLLVDYQKLSTYEQLKDVAFVQSVKMLMPFM